MEPIDAYLPHRGAMRLVDRLLEADEDHAVVEVDVPADGLFMREEGMPGWVGLEYMAQAIAAWSGARARRVGGEPRLGFLLGTRRYTVSRAAFPRGVTLRIEIRRELMGDNGLGQFDCRIKQGDEEIASAMVTVFEPEDPSTLLQGSTG
jgi:predicted hotdog family 3-hydroxylacyl-ACP dehydratase